MEKRFGQPLAWIVFDAGVNPPVVKGSFQVGAPAVGVALREFTLTPAAQAGVGQVPSGGGANPTPGLCLVDVGLQSTLGANFRLAAWDDVAGGPAVIVRIADAAGAAADGVAGESIVTVVWYGGTPPGSV